MQVTIKSRNLDVPDALREYIEGRVSKLDRYLNNIHEARVDISVQNHKSAGDRHTVQLTLRSDSTILRAEDRSGDIRTSVDAVLDKMTRQIDRFKGKHWRARTRSASPAQVMAERMEQADLAEGVASEGEVVRVKRFETRPMDVDEAIEQMELLSHDFFIFYNVNEDTFSVVYRRRDGGYGLLIPDVA